MKEKMSTEEAKEKYKIRGMIAEKPFGDIKENQGMRTFLTRGVDRVQLELGGNISQHPHSFISYCNSNHLF